MFDTGGRHPGRARFAGRRWLVRRTAGILAALAATWPGDVARAAGPADLDGDAENPALERGFRAPPDAHKPWAYGWWLTGPYGFTSAEKNLSQRHGDRRAEVNPPVAQFAQFDVRFALGLPNQCDDRKLLPEFTKREV